MQPTMSSVTPLSAIVCAHNPRRDHISATLASLAFQTGVPEGTELLLIDNASQPALADALLDDLSVFASARIVREERLGLTHARLCGFKEARGELLLFVDDDNVLNPDYISAVHEAMANDPGLGAVGGKSIPRYEVEPPPWFEGLGLSLACRDLGSGAMFADWSSGGRFYPECAPIGAGMAVRRDAFAAWVMDVEQDSVRANLGRKGEDLSSGEDNDLVLTILSQGWKVGYLPNLSLTHLIPAGRLSAAYLKRYSEASNRTWVQTLFVHGLCPWSPIPPWTLPFRKARAYLAQRGWRSEAHAIRWRASCGTFDGQASINHKHNAN